MIVDLIPEIRLVVSLGLETFEHGNVKGTLKDPFKATHIKKRRKECLLPTTSNI